MADAWLVAQSSKLGSKTVSSWFQTSVFFAEVLYLVFGFHKKMLENIKNETSAQGADSPPPTCSEGRYKYFEGGNYPPPPHRDRREIWDKENENQREGLCILHFLCTHTQIQIMISRVVHYLKNTVAFLTLVSSSCEVKAKVKGYVKMRGRKGP